VQDVHATSLTVEVRVTVLPVEIIERGNVIFFIATFAGDPSSVFFSYIKPGENRPNVDPGFSQPGSQIAHLDGEGTFMVHIDTTGFTGGMLRWHFWSEGINQASEFGEVVIPDRPPQLL
jgi:hypothetical protein